VVVSGGHINGNIVASEKVQLLSPGVVTGTIKTPLLSIEEGVHLYGMCDVAGRGEIRALDGQRELARQQLTSVARMRGAQARAWDRARRATSKEEEGQRAGEGRL